MMGLSDAERDRYDDGQARSWKVIMQSGKEHRVRAHSESEARRIVETMYGGRDDKRGKGARDPSDVAYPEYGVGNPR